MGELKAAIQGAVDDDTGAPDVPDAVEAAEEKPLRLLLVDDDAVDRRAVRRALRAAGVEASFEEADDYASAVAALTETAFDGVFLDFRLPGGDGLQVLREVRAAGVRTPIVMLTGQGDEQLAVELMKAGASDYLAKSTLSPEPLAQSLRHVLRVHRAETQTRHAEAAREKAIAARAHFYASMSHELRTPINAIVGYNDLLLASVYGPLSEQQTHGIERSQKAAQHLLELVNDVLDLSKLEAGKVELDPVPVRLPTLVEDLFTTLRPLADQHGCELRLEIDECTERITTDPRRVRQILLNLLSNAVRFGAGRPVRVWCAPTDTAGVRIEVTDHGPGIAPEDVPRVFEEFVQLAGSTQSGTGLGLPISRRLARLLGGKIEVESTPGQGSTFCLTLPKNLPAD